MTNYKNTAVLVGVLIVVAIMAAASKTPTHTATTTTTAKPTATLVEPTAKLAGSSTEWIIAWPDLSRVFASCPKAFPVTPFKVYQNAVEDGRHP